MSKPKIIVFSFQETGHIHPMSCIVRELVVGDKARVICYGTSDTRSIIEKTGAEYRSYSENKDEFQLFRNPTSGKFLSNTLRDATANIEKLAKMLEGEQPELIVYDESMLCIKFTLLFLKNKHKHDKDFRMPPRVMFRSTIVRENNAVYDMLTPKELLSAVVPHLKLIGFNLKFRFAIFDMHKFLFCREEKLNIVSVFPDLQPKLHLYAKTNRFVGCCMKEEFRMSKPLDERLQTWLDSYPVINPVKLDELDSVWSSPSPKLILVSFGTINNVEYGAFLKVLKSLRMLNDVDNFRVIVSVCESIINKLQDKIAKKKLVKPENIVVTTFVPQLEVLKRASIFVTHCGMNSTCESIFYGVPMVCIPMYSDQYMVARRVADDLRLGVRINKGKLTSRKVAKALNEIANDSSYHKRIIECGQVYRQYNGPVNAAKEIFDFLDNSLEEQKAKTN